MLLAGEEGFLVERALGWVRRRYETADPPIVWRTLWGDGDASELGAAVAGLTAPPLFGGVPGLTLRRAEALPPTVEEQILTALPALDPRRGVMVLVARSIEIRRRLPAALAGRGAVFEFPRLTDERSARAWVERLARERGVTVSSDAVGALLERAGTDLAVLGGELEKAACYSDPRPHVDVEAVEAVAAATRPAVVDALSERIAQGDTAGACRVLRRLLADGEPAIKITAFLAAALRRRLHVAELRASGLGEDAVASRLGLPGWLVRRQRTQTPSDELEKGLRLLHALDAALKHSRPEAPSFEAVVLRLVETTRTRRMRGD